MDTEQELVNLENEIRALKTVHPVAASLLKFYIITSQEFTVTGVLIARFQFTPTPNPGGEVYVNLRAVVTEGGSEVPREQVTEPQDGTGNVVIQVQMGADTSKTYKVKIIASGSTPGTFTML